MKRLRRLLIARKGGPVAGGSMRAGLPPGSARTFRGKPEMKTMEMKTVGFAIYDVPPALKAFLIARETGTATKEMLATLSEAAMAEQLAKRPNATIIDFELARLERVQQGEKPCS